MAGLSETVPGHALIPFSSDPKDWMGIAREATGYLLDRGYDYCYLVLDDHPPMATCNGGYLERGLPLQARELGATVVSMVGWDQIRTYEGVRLPPDKDSWLKNDSTYRWLFNLHPACWNLTNLHHILQIVIGTDPVDHSARTFEGVVCAPSTPIPDQYRNSSYRLCGNRFAAGDRWFERPFMRTVILNLLHGIRLSARFAGGTGLLDRVDRRARVYTDYLNGPYPMFWSGLMQRGTVHKNAVRFLRLSGQGEIADLLSGL